MAFTKNVHEYSLSLIVSPWKTDSNASFVYLTDNNKRYKQGNQSVFTKNELNVQPMKYFIISQPWIVNKAISFLTFILTREDKRKEQNIWQEFWKMKFLSWQIVTKYQRLDLRLEKI